MSEETIVHEEGVSDRGIPFVAVGDEGSVAAFKRALNTPIFRLGDGVYASINGTEGMTADEIREMQAEIDADDGPWFAESDDPKPTEG